MTSGFDLASDSANAGRPYLLLGSLCGTEPGIPLPGGSAVLPLCWDEFTRFTLLNGGHPPLVGFQGNLGADGAAFATFEVPPLPPEAVGISLYFAFALAGPWDTVSNPWRIEIAP